MEEGKHLNGNKQEDTLDQFMTSTTQWYLHSMNIRVRLFDCKKMPYDDGKS